MIKEQETHNLFDVIKSDPWLFKKKLEKQGTSCQVIDFGQEITL